MEKKFVSISCYHLGCTGNCEEVIDTIKTTVRLTEGEYKNVKILELFYDAEIAHWSIEIDEKSAIGFDHLFK
ncbi:hypothetical protein ABGV40_15110 [Paenibacillus amylolyticus]|uniref:hypothetical protein n=1 Tax=Paenibacillus amylolyticus TaxID=1451 RepID=UPI003241C74F